MFASLALLLSITMLARLLLERRLPFLRSPLTMLGFLALGLGLLQLIPLPGSLARRLSPAAQEIYSFGVIPALAHADSPAIELGNPTQSRSPATLDRSATLRWLFSALACLGIFWTVSHFTDRLKRLYLVWGCVLAAFLMNGAFGLVQLTGQVEGLYGFLRPARAHLGTVGRATCWIHLRVTSFAASMTRRARRTPRSPASHHRPAAAGSDGDFNEQLRRFPGIRLTRSAPGSSDHSAYTSTSRQPRESFIPLEP